MLQVEDRAEKLTGCCHFNLILNFINFFRLEYEYYKLEISFLDSIKDVFGESARYVLINEMGVDPMAVSHLLNSEIDLKQVCMLSISI